MLYWMKAKEIIMYDVTIRGQEVVVRSRRWFGPFNCVMYEVCVCASDGTCVPIAVFPSVNEAWKFIANAGHRARNPAGLLLAAIAEYAQYREMEEVREEFIKSTQAPGNMV